MVKFQISSHVGVVYSKHVIRKEGNYMVFENPKARENDHGEVVVVRIQQELFNEIKYEGEFSVVDLLEPTSLGRNPGNKFLW